MRQIDCSKYRPRHLSASLGIDVLLLSSFKKGCNDTTVTFSLAVKAVLSEKNRMPKFIKEKSESAALVKLAFFS